MGAAVALSGCFEALADRDCRTDSDCFADEKCRGGRCYTVLGIRADAAPVADPVEVYVFGRSGTVAAASVLHDPEPTTNCQCAASSSQPCLLDPPAAAPLVVCAYSAGHRPCSLELAPGSLRAELYLEACASDGDCPDAPVGCGCEGVSRCGE